MADKVTELLRRAEEVLEARKRYEALQRAFEEFLAADGPTPGYDAAPVNDAPAPPDHTFLRALETLGGEAGVRDICALAYGSAPRELVKRTGARMAWLEKKGLVEHLEGRRLWKLVPPNGRE